MIVASVSFCFINPFQSVRLYLGPECISATESFKPIPVLKTTVKVQSSSLNNNRKYFLYETCHNKGSFMADLQESPHINIREKPWVAESAPVLLAPTDLTFVW